MTAGCFLNWNLSFINVDLELLYKKSKLPYQNIVLKVFIAYALLMSVSAWILNPRDREIFEWNHFLSVVGVVLLGALLLVISKKKPLWIEPSIFCLSTMCFFVSLELVLYKNREFWGKQIYFLAGVNMELLLLTQVIVRINWMKNSLLTVLANCLCSFRYTPFEDNYNIKFFPLITFVMNTVIFCMITFLMEKYHRIRFFENKNNEFTLNCFKDLIETVFPSPIIITKGDDILYLNEEALKTFNCKDKSELLGCFENLIIDIIEEKGGISERFLSLEEEDDHDLLLKNRLSYRNVNHQSANSNINKQAKTYSLLDYLRKSNDFLSKKEVFLKNIRAFYHGDKLIAANNNFDLKVKNVVWEKKYAMMIVISENNMIPKMRQLKEESLYKDNLLATVSHDLRTPLNGIIGMISESLSMISEKLIRKNLEVALRSAQSLLFMINDILDYHQISNGKLSLNFEEFSMWDLIKEVSKLIKFQAKLKNLAFVLENKVTARDSKALIRSDPNRLKQVILNLLGNSLKFTQVGSITVCLEDCQDEIQENKDPNLENLRQEYLIKVSDTGIGIKKEDQGNLFKVFGKLESTKEINKNGIGLGLAISQNLVKILNNNITGGEIKVQSEVGKGTCFYFPIGSTLEERKDDDFEMRASEASPNGIYHKKTKPSLMNPSNQADQSMIENEEDKNKIFKLLIVDDDQINILVATSYLKYASNYKYDTAVNGSHALEKIKMKAKENDYYDLILMDCNMPVMNGYETTQTIRRMNIANELPDVVIIGCTANSSQLDYELCIESGMNDYISKPFSKDNLLKKLKSAISLKNR